MNFLRNPKLLFSSTLLMNMCKGHMSLCMSLKDSCFTKSLLKKFVNTQLLMTIGGGGGIQSLNVKMSPAPPSSTISNDLRSVPFEASNKSKASFQTLDSSDSSESALLQLAKEFNRFYYNGKKKYLTFLLAVVSDNRTQTFEL